MALWLAGSADCEPGPCFETMRQGAEMTLTRAFNDHSAAGRAEVTVLYTVLIGVNVAVWIWAALAFGDNPAALGTAFLAYVLGLRHAVDPDHIAAIDNVVRKLMQGGKRPISVGFFFSLGHSTVVIVAVAVIAATAAALKTQFTAAAFSFPFSWTLIP